MNERSVEMKKGLEAMKKNGSATPEQIIEAEELIQQLESLDSIDAVLNPVLEHFRVLSAVPRDNQTPQQKLWLLAYAFVSEKFSPGTEASIVEAVRLMPILSDTIS